VGIEVVLAGEDRDRLHGATEGVRRPRAELDGAPVQDRQRTRQAEADRAHLGIGRSAEPRAAATENLRLREELRVNFQTDDRLERHERVTTQDGTERRIGKSNVRATREFRTWRSMVES